MLKAASDNKKRLGFRGRIVASESGFTLIEIVLVISIMAVAYFVAIPQLNLATGTEVAVKLGRVAADIRAAYDMAVLSGKPHRLVFKFFDGEYWLEVADRSEFYLTDDKLSRDPTADELADLKEEFIAKFAEYEEMAGEEINDPKSETTIKPSSPLLQAKSKLEPVGWAKVENMEWGVKSIGPYLMIQDMQAEHHDSKQTFEDLGVEARGFLYFFPAGYVERAVIHIAYRDGDRIDESQSPYTIITHPNEGVAEVDSGYLELAEDNERF